MLKITDLSKFVKEYKPVDNYGTLLLNLYQHTYEGTERDNEKCTVYMAVDIDTKEVSFWISSDELVPCDNGNYPFDNNIYDFEDEIPMDFVFKLMSEGMFEYVPTEKETGVSA